MSDPAQAVDVLWLRLLELALALCLRLAYSLL
jgi:hypothetical protein